LKAAPQPVVLLTGAPLGHGSSTGWAQGGVAAALGPDDSAALHAQDTVLAGAGLVDDAAAMVLASAGASEVRALYELGAGFERTEDGGWALSREAAHSVARVARMKGDQAGAGILQTLIEVYSGHGNSEEFRPYRSVDENGHCLPPQPGFEPCCWRAGEIVRNRCEAPTSSTCKSQVEKARADYLSWGAGGHLSLGGEAVEEWLNCGQCTDCFLPAFKHRPGSSVQAALATTDFSGGEMRRFRFGLIGSSDNHTARPGTGYKEVERRRNTDAWGPNTDQRRAEIFNHNAPSEQSSLAFGERKVDYPGHHFVPWERAASFFHTGGLVAVHSAGRDRDSIWQALQAREVYATSGPKMLLWFDLLNGPNGKAVMGSEVSLAETPKFRVRALGAFEQKPGCPAYVEEKLTAERFESLCGGECYNPSDKRKAITRIEVVKIRPQIQPDEDVAVLVEDLWKVFDCPADGEGCVVEFEDPSFTTGQRDAVYYVRAIQEPQLLIGGDPFGCEYDDQGVCIKRNYCIGETATVDNDCLAEAEPRAWSSPIFIDYER